MLTLRKMGFIINHILYNLYFTFNINYIQINIIQLLLIYVLYYFMLFINHQLLYLSKMYHNFLSCINYIKVSIKYCIPTIHFLHYLLLTKYNKYHITIK
jgi:hypothetical protein